MSMSRTILADGQSDASLGTEAEDAVLARARAALAARQWQSSAELFRRLLDSVSYGAEAHYGLGMIALAHRKQEEAEALFVAALRRDKRHANSLYQIAKLRERTSPQEAAAIYSQVLDIDPGHVSAADRLAHLRSELTRKATSRSSPRTMLTGKSLVPSNNVVWRLRPEMFPAQTRR